MKRDCLKIAVFLDGRPGHEKQTLGIVQALGKLISIKTREIPVTRKGFWVQLVGYLRYLLGLADSKYEDISDYELLIGTGTATHLPMLSCDLKYHIPAITCMTPSRILLKKFTLCCVPQHDAVSKRSNVFQTIGPPNCSEAKKDHDPGNALILLGGIDHKSHHWRSDEVESQVYNLVSQNEKVQWTISTSPRTPIDTAERIEKMSRGLQNSAFYHFLDTPPGWVEKEYSRNKTVWVTADSMSMVYEALSAGCNVGILPVRWKKKESKFIRSERYLIDRNIVLSYKAWQAGKSNWQLNEPLNEAKKCAEEILRRWKKKSLQ